MGSGPGGRRGWPRGRRRWRLRPPRALSGQRPRHPAPARRPSRRRPDSRPTLVPALGRRVAGRPQRPNGPTGAGRSKRRLARDDRPARRPPRCWRRGAQRIPDPTKSTPPGGSTRRGGCPHSITPRPLATPPPERWRSSSSPTSRRATGASATPRPSPPSRQRPNSSSPTRPSGRHEKHSSRCGSRSSGSPGDDPTRSDSNNKTRSPSSTARGRGRAHAPGGDRRPCHRLALR